MNGRKKDIENRVEAHLAHLGRFDSPPAEEVARSRERTFDRLLTRAATTTEPAVVDAGRTAWSWRPAIAAVAAVIVIAGVGTAMLWRPAGNALFRVAEGKVYDDGRTIRSNGDGKGVVLALTDGSRVEMRSQSELALERASDGLRVRLIRGGIIVDAAPQRTGHLYVQTNEVTVSVVGTVFLVNADEHGSRVAVIEGEVRVQQGTTEKKLLPGEQVTTSPTMAKASIKEEIAWARNAPVLIGLLQQAVVAPVALAPQNPVSAKLAFEAISIRPALIAPGGAGRSGGGGGGGGRRNQRGTNPCSLGGEPVVDPRRFDAANVTLIQLASLAYGIDCWMNRGPDVLFGGPDWIRKDGYDVLATIPEGTQSYTSQQLRRHEAPALQGMLRSMLEDRFGIVVHREMREMPVYVLSVASGGPKFTRVNPPARLVDAQGNPVDPQQVAANPGLIRFNVPSPDRVHPEFSVWEQGDTRDFLNRGPSEIHGRKRTMADLTSSLWLYMGRPVLDRTGLKGDFNFFLTFVVFECPTCPFLAPSPDAPREPAPPGFQPGPPRRELPLVETLEQVGLEVKPARERIEVLVIDRIERPTEN